MAAVVPVSSSLQELDRRAAPRQPLYGGFDPSQWSIDPTGAETHAKPNSGAHVSHNFRASRMREFNTADQVHEPTSFSPTPNKLKMKGRPRGESDLSRPSMRSHVPNANECTTLQHSSPYSAEISLNDLNWKTEALTALLIPLPFLLSSLLITPMPLLKRSKEGLENPSSANDEADPLISALQACALTSMTLIAVGAFGRLSPAYRSTDPPKTSKGRVVRRSVLVSKSFLMLILTRVVSVLFPFMAVTALGGARTALILLVAIAGGIICPEEIPSTNSKKNWRIKLWNRKLTYLSVLLTFVADMCFKNPATEYTTIIRGYVVLTKATLFIQLPLPTLFPGSSRLSAAKQSLKANPNSSIVSNLSANLPISVLVATPLDTDLTLAAGGLLCVVTTIASISCGLVLSLTLLPMIIFLMTVFAAAGLLVLSKPVSLRSHRKAGLALGTLTIIAAGLSYELHTKSFAMIFVILSIMSYAAVHFDTPVSPSKRSHTKLEEDAHIQHQSSSDSNLSKFTIFLLRNTEGWPLMHSVLASKDSRSIFYFLLINFAFMLIQLFYSVVTESLGLMSDSIHMFFDCFGMLVGLFAAVMTKWPASDRFPYGFGKVNTLSGFANGVFLIFVSIEFIWDSFERFVDGVQLKRVEELFVVSVLGLIVNLIGLKLTHGHHGHSHGPGHNHGHSHHHLREHADGHELDHHEAHSPKGPTHTQHSHHGHQHDDENMLGIYLHILADTMGSVAVILSTALTYLTGHYFWDPLASCIIAVLIMAASYPLVRDSAKKLLLTVPDNVEWKIREALQELSGLRGVVGYGGPRFWVSDSESGTSKNEHGVAGVHDHKHENVHNHQHGINESGMGRETCLYDDEKIFGVIHVIAARSSDLEDVRVRTCQFLQERNMDVVVHVEREGAGRCWCGGDKSGGGIGLS